ncbi:hypothetical protein HNR37_000016 [Desulfurispira natronophila]|uniref:Lipoprotein n=2 Tax=Desulfurispira natronophila TaxID=682562 RepID=A0A7W7Y277_9BACT|nr:hypothetical protein [Desulfurispira natronophila]
MRFTFYRPVACILLFFIALYLSAGCASRTMPDRGLSHECDAVSGSGRLQVEGHSSLRMQFLVSSEAPLGTIHLIGTFSQRVATLSLDHEHVVFVNHRERTWSKTGFADLCNQFNICLDGPPFIELLRGSSQPRLRVGPYQCERNPDDSSRETYLCYHSELPELSVAVQQRRCHDDTYNAYTVSEEYELVPVSGQELR